MQDQLKAYVLSGVYKQAAGPSSDMTQRLLPSQPLSTMQANLHGGVGGVRQRTAQQAVASDRSVPPINRAAAEHAILNRRNPADLVTRTKAPVAIPLVQPAASVPTWRSDTYQGPHVTRSGQVRSGERGLQTATRQVGLGAPLILNHELEHVRDLPEADKFNAHHQTLIRRAEQFAKELTTLGPRVAAGTTPPQSLVNVTRASDENSRSLGRANRQLLANRFNEIPAGIGDLVSIGQRERMAGNRNSDEVVVDPGGSSRSPHRLGWMTDQANQHGYFDGRTMTDLLYNTPEGRQWVASQSGGNIDDVPELVKEGGLLDGVYKTAALITFDDLDAMGITVAGLAVMARNTGRVLMLQRYNDKKDPAGGMWEFPGGHIEEGETSLEAAKREWSEETGMEIPRGSLQAVWNYGIYRGHVWSIANEDQLTINQPGKDRIMNPDDPDGDKIEAVAWWKPELMLKNPSLRPELRASMGQVQRALNRERYLSKEYTRRLRAVEARRNPKTAATTKLAGFIADVYAGRKAK